MVSNRKDLYKQVTDTVIAALESGTIPWEKPWSSEGVRDWPRSVSTGKAYLGCNYFWLQIVQAAVGYSSPWWITYRQAQSLGGSVRKGEKSTPAIFFKSITGGKDDDSGDSAEKTIPLIGSHAVFNLDQCDLPAEAIEKLDARLDKIAPKPEPTGDPNQTIDEAESVLLGYIDREGVKLNHGSDRACYSPVSDVISMPNLESFRDSETYYATLAHEQVHSTGHQDRLNRKLEKSAAFGSADYGREELVAELGASMILSVIGISKPAIEDNRNAYIASWIKSIRNDPKAVVVASGKASKAAEYLLKLDNDGDVEYRPEGN